MGALVRIDGAVLTADRIDFIRTAAAVAR